MSNCFEIYGFDLLLDHDLNPWVIEINLSPACSERQPWLTKMLDDMSLCVLDWLQRKMLMTLNDNFEKSLRKKREQYNRDRGVYQNSLNTDEFLKTNEIKWKWIKCE